MPKIKITNKDKQKIIDIMVKTKEPKLIAPTKAINDSSFLIETFPNLSTESYQELIKALVPIMRKHGILRIQASAFKKWMNGEETMNGAVNPT